LSELLKSTMKNIAFFCMLGWLQYSVAQAPVPVNLYLLPGQGADARLFDSLHFPAHFVVHHISYPIPAAKITMLEFARQLAMDIDTTQPFILMGASFGGMLCAEMSTFLHPQRTIIVSSAKHRKELPYRYRLQRFVPVYRVLPPSVIKMGALVIQPIVEPDRRSQKDTFKSMLKSKDPYYMKRSVALILSWDKTEESPEIIHIHGTKDHIIPMRNVKADVIIPKGSHVMTLTQAEQVQQAIDPWLW
jgi:pimeloyl-ACP methyl ester carboxylesterase